ncbi:TetR/AcrR family transcriptional regulator, partial [Cellulomonas algicola]
AADLVLREGPGALTHRRVAAAAGASLSATTYYFADLDELATAAGSVLARSWAQNASAVLASLDAGPPTGAHAAADVVAAAVLPPGDDDAVRAQYEHLLGSGRNRTLARAFADGRAEVDEVVARVIAAVGLELAPAVAVALVDGAVVTALSEDRPVRPTARDLLLAVAR